MTLAIAGAFALVLANGFFVATEFAIARIRTTQVDELVAAGRPGARSLRHAVDHLDAYLAACQLGITIASIGLGFLAEPAFERLIEPVAEPLGDSTGIAAHGLAFGFAFLVVTLLHVVLGELAPKSLAIARNAPTALAIALPMRIFYVAMKPFVDLFNWLGNLVLAPFGIQRASEVGHAPHSEDELRLLLRQSLREGLIDPEERQFAENVFSFGDRRARQVMVPRSEIRFVTTRDDVERAATVATESGHTRLPLCAPEGGLDTAVGVVNAKDLLAAVLAHGHPELLELARPLERVSDSTLIDELLADLRRKRQHLALVADEHGTTVGLVTLEDIIEEIVGEIEDEFDREADSLVVRREGSAFVKGIAPIHLVEDTLALEFSDPNEATIGGHVIETLGRLPSAGEVVEIDGHRIRIVAVGDARITELSFEGIGGDTPESP
jgi:CBS domain containing-hemolysin-like protein